MRADRLLSIMLLLRGHRMLTARDLVGRLEVSERTVLRDIEALSTAGVPVYAERGRHGGFALLEGFRADVAAARGRPRRPAAVVRRQRRHHPPAAPAPGRGRPAPGPRRLRLTVRVRAEEEDEVRGALQTMSPDAGTRVVSRTAAWVDLAVEVRLVRSLVGLCLASGGAVEILEPTALREQAYAAARAAVDRLEVSSRGGRC